MRGQWGLLSRCMYIYIYICTPYMYMSRFTVVSDRLQKQLSLEVCDMLFAIISGMHCVFHTIAIYYILFCSFNQPILYY